VKLLFDENLSPELVHLLADLFPNSTHVHLCGLSHSDDGAIWEYAKANSFTIVSKDSDFEERCVLFGSPPKLIWVRLHNSSSVEVARVVRSSFPLIAEFITNKNETYLILGGQRKKV
jgi:predicted nuclease of predicted toxin-antitoxin system